MKYLLSLFILPALIVNIQTFPKDFHFAMGGSEGRVDWKHSEGNVHRSGFVASKSLAYKVRHNGSPEAITAYNTIMKQLSGLFNGRRRKRNIFGGSWATIGKHGFGFGEGGGKVSGQSVILGEGFGKGTGSGTAGFGIGHGRGVVIRDGNFEGRGRGMGFGFGVGDGQGYGRGPDLYKIMEQIKNVVRSGRKK